jgi:hypothetical protein
MRRLLISVVILVVLIVLAYLIFMPVVGEGPSLFFAEISNIREIATTPTDLLEAKSRWTNNPIRHYRLKVQHYRSIYPYVNCFQDVEVVNEKVVTTYEDSCTANDYLQRFKPLDNTVTELFAKLQKETTTILFREQNYPGCPEYMGVAITYSSAGYLISAQYSWFDASPWNLGPKTYRAIYGDGPRISTCGSMADPREPDIKVILQPLP